MENVVKTADKINVHAEENSDELPDDIADDSENRRNIQLVISLEGLAARVELNKQKEFSLKTNSFNLQVCLKFTFFLPSS